MAKIEPILHKIGDTSLKILQVGQNVKSAALLALRVSPPSTPGDYQLSLWREYQGTNYSIVETEIRDREPFYLNLGKLMALFPGEALWVKADFVYKNSWDTATTLEEWSGISLFAPSIEDGSLHGSVMIEE